MLIRKTCSKLVSTVSGVRLLLACTQRVVVNTRFRWASVALGSPPVPTLDNVSTPPRSTSPARSQPRPRLRAECGEIHAIAWV